MTKETLEEAAHEYFKRGQLGLEKAADTEEAFLRGAKWQQERIYSEEDMLFAYKQGARLALLSQSELALQKGKFPTPSEWIQQFKQNKL